jgi:glycine betaine/proline transport system ATP-binding protein
MAIMRDGAIVQVGRPVDLILNPVDDYVREFTRDVPWESVLCAADVAEAADGPLTGLGRVAADTPIDSLLGYLGDNAGGVAVEAADGSVIGVARAANVVRALANGCDIAPADVRR